MKRIAVLLVGLVISVVSLYLALKDFKLGELWDAITGVQIGFFLLMVIPYVLTFMSKVWRWRLLFHPDEQRLSRGLLFAGLMMSYVPLPFRAGEVARGVLVGAKSGLPVARVFSTIVVEKVLDVLTLILLLGISLPFVGLPSDLQSSATKLGVVVLLAAVVLLVLVLRPGLARALVGLVVSRLPAALGVRVEKLADQVLQGLAPLSNLPIAMRIVGWSLFTWGINTLTIYLMMRAFNIEVPYMAAVVLVVATNLGMAVPSAPGYIGVFEYIVVQVLTILGVPQGTAQSFAIVYHFIGLVPVATIGVIAALQQGIGLAIFRPAEPAPELPRVTPQPGSRD